MKNRRSNFGFSLIEVLVVLAIIGIISGIAIPSFLGQRRRARVIGDAIANAKVLAMGLETRKAENGTYGTPGATYTWVNGVASDPTFLPSLTFAPGNSAMNFSIVIGPAPALTYVTTVSDPHYPPPGLVYRTDQTGAELFRLQ